MMGFLQKGRGKETEELVYFYANFDEEIDSYEEIRREDKSDMIK